MKLKFGAKKGSDHDSTKVTEPKKSREELRLPGTEEANSQKPFYGIRNYLHQFYQSPSAEDVEGAGGWYLLPVQGHPKRGLYICRAFTIIGLVLLLVGATAIVIGYTWPGKSDRIVRVETDEQGRPFIRAGNMIMLLEDMDPMRGWKFAGLGIFTLGGAILAVSLLIPTCANCFDSGIAAGFASRFDTPNEPPIRIFPASQDPNHPETEQKQPLSPIETKVPVMEEIAKVQPDAEPGEGRITGESLESAENEAEIQSKDE